MSSQYDILSHTDRSLRDHLNHLSNLSKLIINKKSTSKDFITKEQITSIVNHIILFHDIGKSTHFFQKKIIDAIKEEESNSLVQNKEYIEWFESEILKTINSSYFKNNKLSNHAVIGAIVGYYFFRPENEIIKFILFEIIRRHHGNLQDFELNEFMIDDESNEFKNLKIQYENINFDLTKKIFDDFDNIVNLPDFNELMEDLTKLRKLNKSISLLNDEESPYFFFVNQFLFSIFLSLDKGDMMLYQDSSLENLTHISEEIVDLYKKKFIEGTSTIDLEREKSYQAIAINLQNYIENNFFSITLPTGLGKTFSAINTAIKIKNRLKNKDCYRLVYCLPFTSIIDQNAEVLEEILKHNGLSTSLVYKHHYLTQWNLEDTEDSSSKFQELEYLVEGWENEFIITTFVQFLESIFTNKNRSLRKFHNLVNSIIILDEVQNIDPKYYLLIRETFKYMAKYFNTKFVFVTATQPLIMENEDIVELTDPSYESTQQIFENMDRIDIDKSLLKNNGSINESKLEIDEFIELVKDDIDNNNDKSFLIIVNTIKQAQYLAKKLDEHYEVIYLSADIIPNDRLTKIQCIKQKGRRKIAVTTQVVEAGVDIDLDIVYRDFSPLDSINQSAGRCNRNNKKSKGKVKLFNLGRAINVYSDELLLTTWNLLNEYPDIIPENQIYELNKRYFEEMKIIIQDNNDVSLNILKYMNQLQFSKLEEDFKVIEEKFDKYNVFIPVNDKATEVWHKYCEAIETEDVFERKRKIKKIKPDVLQYVTKFPKKYYTPEDEEAHLIYESKWQEYYDRRFGFNYEKFASIDNSSKMITF